MFTYGLKGGRGHSEGYLLYLVNRYSLFKAKYSKPKYQYHYQKLRTKNAAKTIESKLIKDYFKQYGELPPLNSAMPNRHHKKTWGKIFFE